MTLVIEGFAIISEDGMLADASGSMPSTLVIEADQQFLSNGLDRASVIVHGRNSHESQTRSPLRRRLIATHGIKTIAPAPNYPRALLWNPTGVSLGKAAEALGVRNGTVAILGGTEIYVFFYPGMTRFTYRGWRGFACRAGAWSFRRCQNGAPRMFLPRVD